MAIGALSKLSPGDIIDHERLDRGSKHITPEEISTACQGFVSNVLFQAEKELFAERQVPDRDKPRHHGWIANAVRPILDSHFHFAASTAG